MTDRSVHQRILDSEYSYRNSTFWSVQPVFHLIKDGETEQLKEILEVRMEAFPAAGRITKDERKQLEYMIVSLFNTFMIAAIEGGVYPVEANWTADRALKKLAEIQDVRDMPSIAMKAAVEFCEMCANVRNSDTGNPHVENAKHYISTHLSQEINDDDIASFAGISKYHLCRLFREKTGMSMREYLIQKRIEAAKRLLVTDDMPVPRIAALLRFCDQSYFTAVFRRYTGTTPARYRTANKV